jgi:hypothetical protein
MTKFVSLFQYISSTLMLPRAISSGNKIFAGRQEGGRVVHWHMVGFIICRKSEKVEKGNRACWHG